MLFIVCFANQVELLLIFFLIRNYSPPFVLIFLKIMFACIKCYQRFETKPDLSEHFERMHVCQTVFKTIGKRHQVSQLLLITQLTVLA